MKISKWDNYKVIASGDGEKLEQWGDLILLRPDPQAIWKPPFALASYKGLDAKYVRSKEGGGQWELLTEKAKKHNEGFNLEYKPLGLKFLLQLMGFKHTGLFPEQAVNWDAVHSIIANIKRPVNVLNLFAYTGAATLACAKAGASVTQVDASKGMTIRAKENLALSGMADKPVKFIVDDCIKFVEREIRRGNFYNAIILDPPSYGRGPNGEKWKLEDNINELLVTCVKVLKEPLFVLLNCYTTGLQPSVLSNLLNVHMKQFNGKVEAYELALKTDEQNIVLPAGASALWFRG